MAALKHTARARRPARGGGGSDVESRRRIEESLRQLHLVLDILIVCDMALRMQGAEQDQEIADVLRHCGSYRLQGVIEEMEEMEESRRQVS
jgi:hypothetical protein